MVVKIVNKPWGQEEVLVIQSDYVVKRLHIGKGKRCSLQYHKQKTETIYVLEGLLKLHINKKIILMEPGDYYTITPREIHRMEGCTNAVYLECSTTELDDVVRVEDDYGRV